MQRTVTPKTFRLCLRVDELEFLLQIYLEEEYRLHAEIGEIIRELSEIEKKTDIYHMGGDKILETDFDKLHERERELRAEKYVKQARLTVVKGFIERFQRLIQGILPHGGRLTWASVRARETLAFGDAFWFKRPILKFRKEGEG